MKKKWFMFKIKFLKRAKGGNLNIKTPPIEMNHDLTNGIIIYKILTN